MSKPAVNDIAREAGVSLATVDRVLNARPDRGRSERRHLAPRLRPRHRHGQPRPAADLSDRRGPARLASALEAAAALAAASRMEVDLLRFPSEDMHALAAQLADLSDRTDGVALMAPETPVVRDAVNALRRRGIPVLALVSDRPNTGRSHIVGIDSHAARRTAGLLMGRFLGARPARVMVIAPSMLLRDSIERRGGFDEVMLAEFPGIEALQTLETHGSAQILGRVVEGCWITSARRTESTCWAAATERTGSFSAGSASRSAP